MLTRGAEAKQKKESLMGRSQSLFAEIRAKMFNAGDYEYEWGGPLGASLIVLLLPILVILLHVLCNKDYILAYGTTISDFKHQVYGFNYADLWSTSVFFCVALWILFQAALYMLVPGRIEKGVPLVTKERLTYKTNGLACYFATFALLLPAHMLGYIDLGRVHAHYGQILTSLILFAFLLSAYLYLSSFRKGKLLAPHGNSGLAIYDFFVGRELNPRIGSQFDLKYFFEMRPGLIGWGFVTVCMLIKQAQEHSYIANSMLMLVLFQNYYIVDAFYFEKKLLTTMDITTEGFGFMLAFGDLAWVPGIYTLHARYLATSVPYLLSPYNALFCLLLNIFGMVLFRCANSQKDHFRSDPEARSNMHLEYIMTKTRSKLLVSGWWGIARHTNYTGDIIMGIAWTLLCGFKSPVTVFYILYFVTLLVHRDSRDYAKCKTKYGADWDAYVKRVPYSLIPGIY